MYVTVGPASMLVYVFETVSSDSTLGVVRKVSTSSADLN